MLYKNEVFPLVERYFIDRGYTPFISEGYKKLLKRFFDLIFRRDNEVIALKIIDNKAFSVKIKEEIERSIVRILSVINNIKIDRVYIVVINPRYSLLPDIEFFKESGIGLITVESNEKIIERIPAEKRRSEDIVRRSSEKDEIYLLVKDLRTRVYLLEQRLSNFEERLGELSKRINNIEERSISREFHEPVMVVSSSEKKSSKEDLDFLRDNPWLNVLGRKKRSFG